MASGTRAAHRALIRDAGDFIEAGLGRDLGLRVLAARGGLSPFYFQRLFRSLVGETPKQFVRRLRLERAARHLLRPRATVSNVAFEAGYATHEAFTRAFKSLFGVSPLAFRERAPAARPPALPVQVVERRPVRIASARHVGPYDRIGAAFDRVREWGVARGLEPGPRAIGIYLDDQSITAPERTRAEAAFVLEDPAVVDGAGDVRIRELPGGAYAVVRHAGVFGVEDVRASYRWVHRHWLPKRGYRAADLPPFEVYAREDGSDVTTVHIPLRPGPPS